MATRMQQRRGSAAQWTAANPVLAAGEIGFETDTSKFKMGNGTSTWSQLIYFANATELTNAINSVVGMAPETLNTLSEISDALGDNPDFLSLYATNARVDTVVFNGVAALDTEITARNAAISTHNTLTTSVHGIANTSLLATTANVSTAKTEAIADAATASASTISAAISTHEADTTNVHGISDTSLLATTANVATAKTEAITAAGTAADTKVSAHDVDTTNVHGISDTSALALTATVNSGLALKAPLASPTFTGTVSGITKTMVGLGSVDNTTDAAKPVSSATQTALDLKAPLVSPVLTGVPTAPTAAVATNTTQVATTAYVRGEVAALVNSAGATLDTLGEIATALGNDANLSTTLTNAIALKAPIASPTFTGTVTAPAITATALITASESGVAFTDGTQTKEGVASRTPISQKTDSYTLSALTERDSLIEVSKATATTITIPTDATLNFPIGTSIDILQTGAGQVTIAPVSGTVTVNATPGLKLRTTWSSATLFKRAANTWVVFGDLTA